MRKYKNMDDYIIELLKDPEEAEAYLNASIDEYMNDGDIAAFCIALEHLVKSKSSVSEFSEKNKFNRKQLYRIFKNEINPSMDSVLKILNSLGFKVQFKLLTKIA
ncbi:MAG: transcriptional regulator [bacterium]